MNKILTVYHAKSVPLGPSNQVVAALTQTPFAHHADPVNQVNLKSVDAVPNQEM